MANCSSNLQQIYFAVRQYAQDHDSRYPPAFSGGKSYGWADALVVSGYFKGAPDGFQCPKEPNAGQLNPRLSGYTDYFYNAQLQKRREQSLEEISRLILVADGNDGEERTDARYSKAAIPVYWRGNKDSPLYRHGGAGAIYLLVTGQVKWFEPEIVGNDWDYRKIHFQPQKP